MGYLPVFLDVGRRKCLVVGGGRVGAAKARMLLESGAALTVVSPRFGSELLALSGRPGLLLVEREYRRGDAEEAFVVFACTSQARVQEAVASDARACGALLCRSDDGAGSDFMTGGVVRRGEVCVAVSTSGASPSLAAYLTRRLEQEVGSHYGVAATILRSLRLKLASRSIGAAGQAGTGGEPSSSAAGRAQLLAQLLDRNFVELLADNRRAELLSLIEEVVGERLDLDEVALATDPVAEKAAEPEEG